MNNLGFIRVMTCATDSRVANTSSNLSYMINCIDEAEINEVSLIVFPELSVSGYSCGDIFIQSTLLGKCEEAIAKIAEFSADKSVAIIAGTPVSFRGRLYNCAVVIKDGKVKGIVPKTYIPESQTRWFASGSDLIHSPEITYAGFNCIISPNLIFEMDAASIAVQIGEDLWNPIPQAAYHAMAGAQIIATLASGDQSVTDQERRDILLASQSAQTMSAIVYSSASGDSSQDSVFTGSVSAWECGKMLSNSNYHEIVDIDTERITAQRRKSGTFRSCSPDGTPSASYDLMYNRVDLGCARPTDFGLTFYRELEKQPFAPADRLDRYCKTIIDLQVRGLMTRLARIKAKAVIGISGGLDSTLALIVAALAFERLEWRSDGIVAVTMPGFGTTSRTKNNAWDLMKAFGVTCREISIVPACEQHFKDIGHDASVHDATYENTQARERTQILMDIANQTGGIVVGTGDLSELALGWATYNGDHMSMYGVNAGVPKTLVRHLVRWAAENCFKGVVAEDGRSVKEILLDIAQTPISPELLPASETGEIQQVTEDLVGPYELHDFFLYHFMVNGFSPEKILFLAQKAFTSSYDEETIKKWLKTFIRRFFSQQFKRSCMPDGPKVCEVSLSPRGGWHMASDAWSEDFLSEM